MLYCAKYLINVSNFFVVQKEIYGGVVTKAIVIRVKCKHVEMKATFCFNLYLWLKFKFFLFKYNQVKSIYVYK